jgi:glycosyltransferase involved in cell wall biosynthesis
MNILSVHNGYQIRGGEDECHQAEIDLLQMMGHQVDVYSQHNDRIKEISKFQTIAKTLWSTESYRTVRQQMKDIKYDVIHVQNFFPLISPSVYYAAKAAKVPVVQTLHNYRLLCPNGLFFRDGKVCEDCLGKPIPLPGVQNGCYRESHVASAVVATMLTTHSLLNTWNNMVDCYIALTEFARQKFIEGGLPAEKIVVKPHFIDPDPGIGLLTAWEILGNKIPLKIIGDGQLSGRVAEVVNKLPNVEWLGRKPLAEVYDLMGEATVLIFPSKWYETFGRVAIEAFAKGTPVVAANIGAIAELIDPGRTGILFRPGDPHDLAEKIEWVQLHSYELIQMRKEARLEFENKYTAKENYRQLKNIYEQVCNTQK